MNAIERLVHDDEEIIRSALEPYIKARVAFEKCRIAMLIELVSSMRDAPTPTLSKAMTTLNDHLNRNIKPLYGRMMIEKRS